MTGSLETSAITWGDTRLTYSIRRSARRKKTVAVTVDPARWGAAGGPGADQHQPTGCDGPAEGTVDREAAPGGGVKRGCLRPPREFVSGESVMYLGTALPAEGSSR